MIETFAALGNRLGSGWTCLMGLVRVLFESPSAEHPKSAADGLFPFPIITLRIMLAVLCCSGAISLLSSVVTPSRAGPDERHHFTHIMALAQDPVVFPPRYERIWTDKKGDGNHLIHPPLYYMLMALPYRFLENREVFSEKGLEKDRYGFISSQVMVPVLRLPSLAFTLLGLWGIYRLLFLMVTRLGLWPFWAVCGALITTLVPSFTFVGAVLNNDALVLAVWPFLIESTLRFCLDFLGRDALRVMAWGSAVILTKATLWPMLIFCLIAIAIVSMQKVREHGIASSSIELKYSKSRFASLGTLFPCCFLALALYYLLAMFARYGAFQPSYSTVFGILPEQSKWYRGPIAEPLDFNAVFVFAETMFQKLFFSMIGVIRTDAFFQANYATERGFCFILGLFGLILVNLPALYFTLPRNYQSRAWSFVLPMFALGFLMIFGIRAFFAYRASGYIGIQGRYLIGYLHLLIFGLLLQASLPTTLPDWKERLRQGINFACVILLIFSLTIPFGYIDSALKVSLKEKEARVSAKAERQASRW